MALFFQKQPAAPLIVSALADAFTKDPNTIPNPQVAAQTAANQIRVQTAVRFSWGHLAVAILLLVIILFAAIYTGNHQDKLGNLYNVLVHAFELILGAVVGLLTGEAISNQ